MDYFHHPASVVPSTVWGPYKFAAYPSIVDDTVVAKQKRKKKFLHSDISFYIYLLQQMSQLIVSHDGAHHPRGVNVAGLGITLIRHHLLLQFIKIQII